MNVLILILPIILEATARGFNFRGYTKPVYWNGMNLFKTLDHWLMELLVLSFFGYALYFGTHLHTFNPYWKLGQDILLYIGLRIVCFNYIHNLAAGLKWNHIGQVSWFDRVLNLITIGNLGYWIALQVAVAGVIVWKSLKGLRK